MANPRFILPPATGIYVWLFTPQPPMDGSDAAPKYSMTLLWDKTPENTKGLEPLRTAILEAATQKWGAKATDAIAKGKLKMPLKDGDQSDNDLFAGRWVLTCRSQTKPGVVDADVQPIIDPNEVYSGATYRVAVTVAPYDHPVNKGISCYLGNVQKVKDGERLVGRSAEQDFADFVPAKKAKAAKDISDL
jgi:hypothetical protein